MSARKHGTVSQFWVHLFLIPICILTLYPVLWVVGLALSPGQAHLAQGLWPLPAHPSLEHFSALLASRDADGQLIFIRQLLNSLMVASATTIMKGNPSQVLVTTLAAKAVENPVNQEMG